MRQFADDWTPEMERGEDCEAWAPVDPEALVETVREALRRVPRPPSDDDLPNYLRFKDMEALDTLAHELKRLKVGRDDLAGAYRVLEGELNIAEAKLFDEREVCQKTYHGALEDAEVELARVKAERDGQREEKQIARSSAAANSALLDKALAALREIAEMFRERDIYKEADEMKQIARAAIAEIEGEA